MYHSSPRSDVIKVNDVDKDSDFISVAVAFDDTVEFNVVDSENSSGISFSSMTRDQAIKFANDIIGIAS